MDRIVWALQCFGNQKDLDYEIETALYLQKKHILGADWNQISIDYESQNPENPGSDNVLKHCSSQNPENPEVCLGSKCFGCGDKKPVKRQRPRSVPNAHVALIPPYNIEKVKFSWSIEQM